MLLSALLMSLLTSPAIPVAGTQETQAAGGAAVAVANATIEAIDPATRNITLKFEDGTKETATAGPEVKRFDQLKVGDKIKFRYYEAVAYQLRKAGSKEPAPQSGETAAMARGTGATPGGTVAREVKKTVTVQKVDLEHSSITVKMDDGTIVTRKVKDKKRLEGVAAGDLIDITYTEALMLSVEPQT